MWTVNTFCTYAHCSRIWIMADIFTFVNLRAGNSCSSVNLSAGITFNSSHKENHKWNIFLLCSNKSQRNNSCEKDFFCFYSRTLQRTMTPWKTTRNPINQNINLIRNHQTSPLKNLSVTLRTREIPLWHPWTNQVHPELCQGVPQAKTLIIPT